MRRRHHKGMAALSLGALGIVFGDIGTSPLYSVQTGSARWARTATPSPTSRRDLALFWALMIVVTVKYVAILMRADNQG